MCDVCFPNMRRSEECMKFAKFSGWFLVISGPITFLAGLFMVIITSIDLPFQGSPGGYGPLWQMVVFWIAVFLVPGIVTVGGFNLLRPTRKSKRFRLILGIIVSTVGIGGILYFGVNFTSFTIFELVMSIVIVAYFVLVLSGGLCLIIFRDIKRFTDTVLQATDESAVGPSGVSGCEG